MKNRTIERDVRCRATGRGRGGLTILDRLFSSLLVRLDTQNLLIHGTCQNSRAQITR